MSIVLFLIWLWGTSKSYTRLFLHNQNTPLRHSLVLHDQAKPFPSDIGTPAADQCSRLPLQQHRCMQQAWCFPLEIVKYVCNTLWKSLISQYFHVAVFRLIHYWRACRTRVSHKSNSVNASLDNGYLFLFKSRIQRLGNVSAEGALCAAYNSIHQAVEMCE
jgi:hypothetical protein